jgi:N-acyl-L-homoserine lactone synthetase
MPPGSEFIKRDNWESSRICAVAAGQPQRRRNGVNCAQQLIAGIGEIAVIAGLTQIVSVFDPDS